MEDTRRRPKIWVGILKAPQMLAGGTNSTQASLAMGMAINSHTRSSLMYNLTSTLALRLRLAWTWDTCRLGSSRATPRMALGMRHQRQPPSGRTGPLGCLAMYRRPVTQTQVLKKNQSSICRDCILFPSAMHPVLLF